MSLFKPPSRLVGVLAALALGASGVGTAHAADSSVPSTNTGAKAAASSTGLTRAQAQAQARKTGKSVPVPGAETATDTLEANPDGSFTLTTYAQPVRKRVNGIWHDLDATLVKNADGTISPALSNEPLTLSGGGKAPLGRMRSGTDSLALTLSTPLPAPTLSGPTATYHNVLPGVDLVVTATAAGGFSDVYVVHNAAAAADPRLTSLLSATTTTTGVSVSTDASGNIRALDAHGRAVFTAAAPELWDSATDASVTDKPATKANQTPTHSSVAAPGTRAHQGRLTAHVSGHTLTLSPDASVLRNSTATYPIYLDPTWTGGGGANTSYGWATLSENYPTTPEYDNSPEYVQNGAMQVGQSQSGFWADSLVNVHLPLSELGAEGTSIQIDSATFTITDTASTNCTAQTVALYAPAQTLVGGSNTNATWNNWFTSSRNLGSAIATAPFADASKCAAENSGGFTMAGSSQLKWLTDDVANNKTVQTLALAGTSYSAEQYNGTGAGQNDYEVFNETTPRLQIKFEHAPAAPKNLTTSPNASTIGNGSVTLNALVSDPDGGTLTAKFNAYLDGHPSDQIASASPSAGSGTTASLFISQAKMNAALANTTWGESPTNTTMKVDWTVTVSDAAGQSASSSIQSFTYTTATAGAPGIFTDSGYGNGCPGTGYTVGSAITLYVQHNTSSSTLPTSYTYQVNAGAGASVGVDGNHNGVITFTPASSTDLVTVNAVSAGGNIGQTQTCLISAGNAPNAAPGDLTGDTTSDLLLTGQGNSALPDGLWLAPAAAGNGQVSPDPVNLGQYGTGVSATDTSPSTFHGTQTITGLFGGSGFNDVMVYNPVASGGVCSGEILNDDGQITPLNPMWGTPVLSPVFTYTDPNTQATSCATSLGNGGGLSTAEGQGTPSPVYSFDPGSPDFGMAYQPDLLEVVDGSLYLETNTQSEGAYVGANSAYDLSDTNPTGTGSWSGWTITTTDTAADIPAMFAINSSTGKIYYYSPTDLADLAYNVLSSPGTPTTVDPTLLSGLTPASFSNVQATLVGTTPGLLATSTNTTCGTALSSQAMPLIGFNFSASVPCVSTYTVAGSSLAQTGSGSPLHTSAHDWALNDTPNAAGTVTSAADSAGTLNLTGHGTATGVTSSSGDLFSPDASFDGQSGYLASTGTTGAINPAQDFSISAWVKPTVLGGTVLSQSSAKTYPVLKLASTAQGTWQFSLNTTPDGSGNTYTTVTGGTVRLGLWTQLTVTYNAATNVATLYADGNEVAVNTDTAPPTDNTGAFLIGATQTNGTGIGNDFTGAIADVQTDTSVAVPLVTSSGPSDYVPLTPTRVLDTRTTGAVAANSTTTVAIAGTTIGGQALPATGVTAVAISLTETGSSSNGYLSAYPDGTPQPITSTVNYSTSGSYTNNTITPVGADGKIAVYNNSSGTAQIIIDVTGYYTTDTTSTNASTYMPLSGSTRILDTRKPLGVSTAAPLGSNASLSLAIAGNNSNSAGIPADGSSGVITGVAITLTAVNSAGNGQLIAYRDGDSKPNTFNLNYTAGNNVASTVIVPVGTDGKIDVYNSGSQSVNVVGDVTGYYTTATTGEHYFAAGSDRVLDTRRYNPNTQNDNPVAAGDTINLPTPSEIPASNPSLVLNVTVTSPTAIGVLSVYPHSLGARPTGSALNWASGQTVANLSLATSTSGGGIDLYNNSTGTIQLIIDTNGYFA